MILKSLAFRKNHPIPPLYSQEGKNISPPLEWSGIPENARSLALVCEDPDAPGDEPYVHWLAYNISPTEKGFLPGVEAVGRVQKPCQLSQGKNSAGRFGYVGPMPPVGHGVHHYIFRLYALNAQMNLRPGIDVNDLLEAIEEHVIEVAQLVGTYVRTGEARKAG